LKTQKSIQVGSTRLTKDGTAIEMDISPQIVESRTFIPLRFLAESLGSQVSWDDAEKAAGIRYGDQELTLRVGQFVEDNDAAPFIENGRVMVPVRAAFEFFDASVNWNGDAREIVIVKQTV
jgi:hypothetical protein